MWTSTEHKISVGTVKKKKIKNNTGTILFILQCNSRVQHCREIPNALGGAVLLEYLVLSKN